MQHMCFIRHRFPEACAWNAIGTGLSHLYDICGMAFPDISTVEGLKQL